MARRLRLLCHGTPRCHPGLEFRVFETVGTMVDARHELEFDAGEATDRRPGQAGSHGGPVFLQSLNLYI